MVTSCLCGRAIADGLTRAPGMRSFMRFSARRTVLLPQPEGLIIAVIWCSRMGIVVPRTAS